MQSAQKPICTKKHIGVTKGLITNYSYLARISHAREVQIAGDV